MGGNKMSNKPDGGPAFPHHETTSRGEPYHDHLGMSLRDWFAGQVLAGDMACQNEQTGYLNAKATDDELRNLAKLYYRIADAMIAERNK